MELKSDSAKFTLELGMFIGRHASPGDLICLQGGLGTGKTVFVRGVARGRGYTGEVTSPTFTIIKTYPEAELCHADAFRLENGQQLIDAGIEEFLEGEWVCALEWADRVRDALPVGSLELRLRFGETKGQRLISVEGGGKWAAALERFEKEGFR